MAWKQILLAGDAAVLSDTAPVNLDFGAASAGVATDASRQDHKHDLTDATTGEMLAVDGSAEAVGTASSVSRGDHRHALGPLVADLDFAQNNALFLALQVLATPPSVGTEVEGQIYHDSVTDHPYIWTP